MTESRVAVRPNFLAVRGPQAFERIDGIADDSIGDDDEVVCGRDATETFGRQRSFPDELEFVGKLRRQSGDAAIAIRPAPSRPTD